MEICILGATDLRRELFDTPDAYVRVYLDEDKNLPVCHSHEVANEQSPQWGDCCILSADAEHERINSATSILFSVADDDLLTCHQDDPPSAISCWADDLIGEARLPVDASGRHELLLGDGAKPTQRAEAAAADKKIAKTLKRARRNAE